MPSPPVPAKKTEQSRKGVATDLKVIRYCAETEREEIWRGMRGGTRSEAIADKSDIEAREEAAKCGRGRTKERIGEGKKTQPMEKKNQTEKRIC